MARISEFYQSGVPDQVEVAITPDEYANLGTGPDQLRLRVSTFTRPGAQYANFDLSTQQSAWTLDPDTNEYFIVITTNGQHNANFQGIALGSLTPAGTAGEVYDAYMVGTFGSAFNFGTTSDTVTSSTWIPVGTPFTDILQTPVSGSGSGSAATVRWDSPDINTPIVTRVSGLRDTGAAPICLAAGTKILTDNGEVLIEDLRPGALVQTLDHGLQPVKWISSQNYEYYDADEHDKFLPIKISKDSFGRGFPSSDMRVSRQHRILIETGPDLDQEVLVPAIKLARIGRAEVDKNCRKEIYFNILFDFHEIIMANGLPVESLLLGPQAIKQMRFNDVQEAEAAVADKEQASIPARRIVERKSEVESLKIIDYVGEYVI